MTTNNKNIYHEHNENNTKFYSVDLDLYMTRSAWVAWFNEKGNHNFDGWSNAELWFSDMLKDGLIAKVVDYYETPYIATYHKVDENGNGYTEFEENTEKIYIMNLNCSSEDSYTYYSTLSENNGIGTYKEIKEIVEDYINFN